MISLIETDGTYVSFWAEKPPNLLSLQLDAMLRFNFLGALTDAEITGCLRVEFRGEMRFLPLLCVSGWEGLVLSWKSQGWGWGWRQGGCSGWVVLLCWWFGVLGAEQKLGGLSWAVPVEGGCVGLRVTPSTARNPTEKAPSG